MYAILLLYLIACLRISQQVNIRAHLAAEHGHEDVALTLLSHNADQRKIKTIAGREDERKFLVGRTPLHWAAVGGHEGVVFALVEHGADMSAQNASGRSALQDAI